MKTKFRILFLAAFWLCQLCQAQSFKFNPDRYTRLAKSAQIISSAAYPYSMPLTTNDANWTQMVATPSVVNNNYKFKSVQDVVRLAVYHDTFAIVPAYKYRVAMQVYCYNYATFTGTGPSNPYAEIKTITMDISYDPDSLKPYQDFSVFKFYGYHGFLVKVTGVTNLNTGTAVAATALASNFYIETEVGVQRYDLSDCNYTTVLGNALSADNKQLQVKWALYSTGSAPCSLPGSYISKECKPASYELEWTYIDDYRYDLSTGTASYAFSTPGNINYDFRRNSTRVQVTAGMSYQIPLIYEHGAILYRVRTVRPVSTNYQDLQYGAWTLADVGTADASSSCFPGSGYLITAAHMHDSMNWQYTINFAEDAKYKHVINYFDGALKDRQTQTKINTDNNYIISVDKAYDYEGRPSLVTLPTPLYLQNSLSYRPDLMLHKTTGQPYTAADFDGLDCGRPDSIAPLSTSAAANIYYSTLNTDKSGMQAFVPDAQGYPLVQTIYSPDNTNKIMWQGGAGWQQQIWRGHATQYEYIRPVQTEMDRLLGTEAGKYANYPKQVVTDPNGQSSFSIMDPNGKVVVSGLQGDAPDTTVYPLDTLTNFIRGKQECTNLLADMDQDTTVSSLEAATTFYQDHNGDATFKYSIQTFPFATPCMNKYLRAKAQYSLLVSNDCGTPVTNTSGSSGFSDVVSSGAATYTAAPTLSVVGMPKGKYLVSKKVSFSLADIRHLVDSFVFANEPNCYNDVNYFIKQAVDSTDFPCAGFVDTTSGHCDVIRQQMMRDLYPNAKYGRFLKGDDSLFAGGVANSIFTRIGTTTTNRLVYQSGAKADGVTSIDLFAKDLNWEYSYDQKYWGQAGSIWIHQNVPWFISGSDTNRFGNTYFRASINIPEGVNTDSLIVSFTGDLDSVELTVNDSLYFPADVPWHMLGKIPLHTGLNDLRARVYNSVGQIGFWIGIYEKVPAYTYQDTCIKLPDSVVKDGVVYKNLRNLPVQTFIDIFNDQIAAALLPLHPEYCKLDFCNDADYEQLLQETYTFKQAEARNMFKLDSLAKYDPLILKGTNTLNKLKILRFPGGKRLDSIAIQQAYCGGGNGEERQWCLINQYPTQINNLTFINDTVKQAYFDQLKALYLGNRNLIRQNLLDSAGRSCSTCLSRRLTRSGAAAAIPMDTALRAGTNSYDTFPEWIKTLFRKGNSGDTTGMAVVPSALKDSINSVNKSLYNIQANELIRDLQNCSLNPTLIDKMRVAAYNVLNSGRILTPQIVKSIIVDTAGLTVNDLCHPFLVSYNMLPSADPDQLPYACGDTALYNGLLRLLQRTETINEIKTAPDKASGAAATGSSSFALNAANAFESQFGTSATVRAYTEGASAACTSCIVSVVIAGNAKTDIIHLVTHDYGTTPDIKTTLLSGSPVYNFSKAYCINNDTVAMNNGYIAKRTAVVQAACSTACTVRQYFVWSEGTDFMTPSSSGSNLKHAVTCVDIKNAVDSFNANQATYGYSPATNHPLASTTFRNYFNYKFAEKYTYEDYYQLMEGCAVTDKSALRRLTAGYRIEFNLEGAANVFANTLNTFGRIHADYLRYKNAAGNVIFLVDFNSVSPDSLLVFKTLADGTLGGFSFTNVVSRAYNYNPTDNNTALLFAVPSCTFTPATYAPVNATETVSVWENNTYKAGYKLYTMRQNAGATPKQEADMISSIDNYLHNTSVATMPSCNSNYAYYGRELLRSADYSSTIKQQYLTYVYGLSSSISRAALLAAIDPATLGTYLTSFSSKTFTYEDPYCSGNRNHLYAYTPSPSPLPAGYDLAKNTILSNAGSTLFPNADFTNISALGYRMAVIRKANGDYWYRYFDASNKLYNLYITPPSPALGIAPSSFSFSLSSTRMGAQPNTFTVDVTSGGNTVRCNGYADFSLGSSDIAAYVILDRAASGVFCFDSMDCEHELLATAIQNGRWAYDRYFDSVTERMSNDMLTYVQQTTKDSIIYCGQRQQYQQTLYYYDLAGNLARTVPPAGVVYVADATLPTVVSNRNGAAPDNKMTSHTKVSTYSYNALNLLNYQKTPDGGTTYFFYDGAGRQIFSQNSKQRPDGKYTYSLYDKQGRPIETGQVKMGCTYPSSAAEFDTTYCNFYPRNGTSGTMVSSAHPDFVQYSYDENSYPYDTLVKYVRSKAREEVVVTTYDTMTMNLDTFSKELLSKQENLRSRVSAIRYYLNLPPSTAPFPDHTTFGSYYSYDLNGNVQTISYEFFQLDEHAQRFKRVDYDYDLISGKVNMISLNRGRPDQFYQQYDYDADNRIIQVNTSNDGLIWNKDARYAYYKHGPLASLKAGDLKVQSLEYAYTIQGWLKALNGDLMRPDKDMGQNGASGDMLYAKDVVTHALQYFRDDYKAIGTTAVTTLPEPAKSLYNGNISQQTTGIGGLGNMQRSYRYDQLQRLKLATNANVNDATASLASSPAALYRSSYTYDKDGNLLTLQRTNGGVSPTMIDNLVYSYESTATNNNKLLQVQDLASTPLSTDLAPGQPADNYSYDRIGNLTRDKQGAELISWDHYGKVTTIRDTVTNRYISFQYDGKGNRIWKEVATTTGSNDSREGEYYVRDAGGNMLGVYRSHSIYSRLTKFISLTGIGRSTGGTTFTGTFTSLSDRGLPAGVAGVLTTSHSTWVDGYTARPISFYMTGDPTLKTSLLYSGDAWIDALRSSDVSTGAATHRFALIASAYDALPLFTAAMLYPTEGQKLFQQFSTSMSQPVAQPIWSAVGAAYIPGNHVANGNSLFTAVTNNPGFQQVTGQNMINAIVNNINTMGASMATPFYNAIIADNTLWTSPALRGTSGPWTTTIRGVMNLYGSVPKLTNFFDTWVGGPSALTACTTPDYRLTACYDADPATTLGDMVTEATTSELGTVLTGLPDLTVSEFADKLVIAGADEPTVRASLIADVSDTLALSEHHIYGSSRLGVQRYDSSATLSNTRTAADGTKLRLNTKERWYSYNYGDLVDSTKKEPYGTAGNTDITTFTASPTEAVTRNLGRRYYEMSDHLGNVLATVPRQENRC